MCHFIYPVFVVKEEIKVREIKLQTNGVTPSAVCSHRAEVSDKITLYFRNYLKTNYVS